jgi:hypothetical protein
MRSLWAAVNASAMTDALVRRSRMADPVAPEALSIPLAV